MSDQERNSKKPKIEAADIDEADLDQDDASDNELESEIQITKKILQEMMIVLAGWACDDHMFPIPWQKRIADLSFRCTLSFSRLHTNVDPCDLEQIRPEIDRLVAVYHTVKDFLTDLTKGSIWARVFVRTPSDPGDEDPADN